MTSPWKRRLAAASIAAAGMSLAITGTAHAATNYQCVFVTPVGGAPTFVARGFDCSGPDGTYTSVLMFDSTLIIRCSSATTSRNAANKLLVSGTNCRSI
ncbi:hypothetical protein JOF56_006890 [Kibdelosporangium banguiense]|uniref:Alpha amylase inhibitor n=1 Tax=Kibdelosporangium banguiense TaxID=1365924 RepID=A0ABS4TQ20_9PSEU|nr:hypothetical protein [Kibdelosporangium banguiense]MBP2326505.1 hypothetical protein [Kibdelosporangium banguiense]